MHISQELGKDLVQKPLCACNGNILSAAGSEGRIVLWDVQAAGDLGLSVHGTPERFVKLSSWKDWSTPSMRMNYAIAGASFFVTTAQIASFSKALPTPQGQFLLFVCAWLPEFSSVVVVKLHVCMRHQNLV